MFVQHWNLWPSHQTLERCAEECSNSRTRGNFEENKHMQNNSIMTTSGTRHREYLKTIPHTLLVLLKWYPYLVAPLYLRSEDLAKPSQLGRYIKKKEAGICTLVCCMYAADCFHIKSAYLGRRRLGDSSDWKKHCIFHAAFSSPVASNSAGPLPGIWTQPLNCATAETGTVTAQCQ